MYRNAHLRLLIPVALAAGLAACASQSELDPRQLQQAETAIDEAREVNAARHAAGILARAQERLTAAREAIDNGEEERASQLVNEAVVLAELAEAKALERDSELALAQIRDNLEALEQRLN